MGYIYRVSFTDSLINCVTLQSLDKYALNANKLLSAVFALGDVPKW